MSNSVKKQVLSCFKQLQRTRQVVFKDDEFALNATRNKITSEFIKQKDEKDLDKIQEFIKLGNEVEIVLRKSVIQSVETEPGLYQARIRKDIEMQDSTEPYTPMPDSMIGPFKSRKQCKDITDKPNS